MRSNICRSFRNVSSVSALLLIFLPSDNLQRELQRQSLVHIRRKQNKTRARRKEKKGYVRAGPVKNRTKLPEVEARQTLQIRTTKLEALTVAQ